MSDSGKGNIASDRSLSVLEALLANCQASAKVLEEKMVELRAQISQLKSLCDYKDREIEKQQQARKELQERYDRLRFG